MAEQHEWLTKRLSRRAVLRAGAVTGATALGTMLWTQPARAAGGYVFGEHIAYGPDPRRTMIVGFATSAAFTSGSVRATEAGGGSASAEVEVQMVRASTKRYCRATLTGLKPDTSYDYVIVLDSSKVSTGKLTTAPVTATGFRFTAFGDQAEGAASRAVLARVATLEPRVHLVAGDLCYADSGGSGRPTDKLRPGLWDRWLKQNSPVARSVPWMCAMGNHEMEPGYAMHGYAGVVARVPIGGQSPLAVPVATTFTVGNVGFISLDSNDVSFEIPANCGWTNHEQTRWLESTLQSMRQRGSGIDFIVAYMHHSAYCTNNAHGSEGGIRQAWVPLFDKYSVDLVIAGHNHCYERSLPMRAGKPVAISAASVDSARGTTYVTAGGGGQTATTHFYEGGVSWVSMGAGREKEAAPWSVLSSRTAEYAVLCADVTPATIADATTRMRLRAVAADGRVLDDITLDRTSATLPVPDGRGWQTWLAGGAVVAAGAAVATGTVLHRRSSATADTHPPAH